MHPDPDCSEGVEIATRSLAGAHRGLEVSGQLNPGEWRISLCIAS